ncbi:MAG: hypothetical protein KBS68_01800 [Clostridiales bacterium]|nr:hypothetical protein [Candidatus Crickella merdequi]
MTEDEKLELTDVTIEELEEFIIEAEASKKLQKEQQKNPKRRLPKVSEIHLSKAVAALLVAVVFLVGGSTIAAIIEHQHQQKIDDYMQKMKINAFAMAVKTETSEYSDGYTLQQISDMTLEVWHDAIYHTPDSDTAPYVTGAGDFNEALRRFFQEEKVQQFFNNALPPAIDFSDCPEELDEIKEAYKDMLDAYIALVTFVQAPNASYNTYNSIRGEKYMEFVNAFYGFIAVCPLDDMEEIKDNYHEEDMAIDYE